MISGVGLRTNGHYIIGRVQQIHHFRVAVLVSSEGELESMEGELRVDPRR